jgi:hypothetical protein
VLSHVLEALVMAEGAVVRSAGIPAEAVGARRRPPGAEHAIAMMAAQGARHAAWLPAPLVQAYFGDGASACASATRSSIPSVLPADRLLGGWGHPSDERRHPLRSRPAGDGGAAWAAATVATPRGHPPADRLSMMPTAACCATARSRLRHQVAIGCYMIEPAAGLFLRPGERIDMPDLVQRLLDAGSPVASHPHPGRWIDVGRPDDLQRAQAFAVPAVREAVP